VLKYDRIGEAGAAALAASPHLARLRTLDLQGNQIGDAGAAALASSPHLAGLDELNVLYDNRMKAAGRAALRQRFGGRVRC
jgi:hypothetical protein